VRIKRLQVERRYFIIRVERMTVEGTACIFLTLIQCARSHIYTLVPLDTFSVDTVRDINNGVAVATVAYVGRDSGNILGVAFSIQ